MFLSFIVPVYNTGKYLAECLDSLLDQGLSSEQYEVICVNDGSTDDSYDVLQAYADSYENIHVIHQQNAGVCAARNAGLRCAQGEYIWFIDSDDCLLRQKGQMLLQTAAATNADRIVVDNYRFLDGEAPYQNLDTRQRNTIWKDSSACRSIFKKTFLTEHGLSFRYPELTYGEDALFMYEVKFAEPETTELMIPIYGYRNRENSASHSTSTETMQRQLRSTMREAKIMKDYYESGRTESLTADRFMSYLFGALYHIAAMPRSRAKEYMTELRANGLFPYCRPKACTIRRSYQMKRGDIVEKVHDAIYINISTRIGYSAMRCWNALFRIKNKLMKK